MKFVVLSALAALGSAQYAAPAPPAYVAPPPAAYVAPAPAPVPGFALAAGQCQSAAIAGKAVFAKFCFAPKPGSPLDKVLGLIQERLDTIQAAAVAATTAAAAAQASVASLTASFTAYTAQANGCTAFSANFNPEYQACMASPGFCNPSANLTCGTGFECTNFTNVPTPVGAPTGYCTAVADIPTPAEICAQNNCDIATSVCFLVNADPPTVFFSCGDTDPLCTTDGDCDNLTTCQLAQSDSPNAPVAYPPGVMTCQPR